MGGAGHGVACHPVAVEAELGGHEVEHRSRDRLTRLDQSSWVPKSTELKREAETVGGALPTMDQNKVRVAEHIMGSVPAECQMTP